MTFLTTQRRTRSSHNNLSYQDILTPGEGEGDVVIPKMDFQVLAQSVFETTQEEEA
jgi:hypothetical protein